MDAEKHIGDSSTIGARIVGYVQENGATRVENLFHMLSKDYPTLTRSKVTEIVQQLHSDEKIGLEDMPPSARSFTEYLKLWERNIDLYATFTLAIATVLAVYAFPSDIPLVIVRWMLGLTFVLLVPGYVTVKALFPDRGSDLVEVLALSIGLSLGLMVIVGFLLNYTPWGIRLTSIVISLVMLTVVIGLFAFARQYATDRSAST